MKQLILDYSKWRCGGDADYGDNKLGKGDTALLNPEGFLCCLGQFSLQLNTSITENDIYKNAEPEDIGVHIDLLTYVNDNSYRQFNTKVSGEALAINDDMSTTPEIKIELLKELFSTVNCEIKVINLPKITIYESTSQ